MEFGAPISAMPERCCIIWLSLYSPELGRWTSRDPIAESDQLRSRHTRTPLRNETDFAYVRSEPLTSLDPFGLYSWSSSCSSFYYGTTKGAIDSQLNSVAARLVDICSGNSCYWNGILKIYNLTHGMACCIADRLGGSDWPRISCGTYGWPCGCPPYPAGFAGYPLTILLCPGNIASSGLPYVQTTVATIIHEAAHKCGKSYHNPPDDPEMWENILSGAIALPKPRKDDCCFVWGTPAP